ncbi:uncharacterized protein LOC115438577 isoform X8 [Sphaeramia orbicularis]|uniref:uncharacterized protein LOC115438577 isoform X8 n=1 Tax=Sphaeramia orbicularis TaxID=375764 RepID=UPI00117E1C18|nr:uncharacterized protein LOC115438577 isoform X8 [Sphaeramia orbicularis]
MDPTHRDPIEARVGDNVTLLCEAPGGVDFEDIAVKWTRLDLGSDQYVFFYRDDRPYPYYQYPSYQDRVDLVHSQLMGGDLSVVLKNVTTNDSGTFECRLIQELGNKEKQFYSKLLSTIVLKVSDPAGSSGNRKETGDDGGHEDSGNLGLTVGLSVIGFTGFIVAVLLVSRRRGVSCRGPSVFSRDLEDRCSTVSETVESMV